MRYNFKSYNPKQILLLPPSLDEWLPQNHLARFISEVVDQMDLSELISLYRANGQGSAAYHPAMMTKILLYAYCIGMPSSRKIAKALVDDVAFRWLAAGNFPDFRTISEFRRRHLEALKNLFPQILLLCKKSGLVKAGVIALDGTKVKGNASFSRNKTYKQLCKEEKWLRENIEKLLARAENTDKEEDRIYGDRQGDELPDELSSKKKRLARIKEAKKYLEEKARKEAEKKAKKKLEASGKEKKEDEKNKRKHPPQKSDETVKPDAKVNMTDFESRIQKNAKGYLQGYNAQAVATEDQVIAAFDVVNDANDYHQFQPMLDQAQENLSMLKSPSKTILADAGYCSESNLEYLESRKDIDGLISTRKEKEMRKKETASPSKRRSRRYSAMDKKLRRPVERYIYGFRKRIIEPVFGQMKQCHGFSGFLLRGLEKVRGEFGLWCSAHNILKLYIKNLGKGAITA